MFRANVRILIELAALFLLLSILFDPSVFITTTGLRIPRGLQIAIITALTFLGAGIFYRYLFERYKEEIFEFLDNIGHSPNLKNELQVVKKTHSRISREWMAKLLQENDAIYKSTQRIRFDFYKVCFDTLIYAHKLVKNYKYRVTIAKAISTKIKKAKLDFDIIFSSDTWANRQIANSVGQYTSSKPHHFYKLSPSGDVSLISSSDFRAFKHKNPLNVLVLESILVTPKPIYKLKQCLSAVEKLNDNNIVIVGVAAIFNGYTNNAKAFRDRPHIKFLSLFEINQNQLATSDCPGCYEDKCTTGQIPDIDKNLIFN